MQNTEQLLIHGNFVRYTLQDNGAQGFPFFVFVKLYGFYQITLSECHIL